MDFGKDSKLNQTLNQLCVKSVSIAAEVQKQLYDDWHEGGSIAQANFLFTVKLA